MSLDPSSWVYSASKNVTSWFVMCGQILKVAASLQGGISNILEEMVVQPLLVSVSALTLATETVRSILKIDDVVSK